MSYARLAERSCVSEATVVRILHGAATNPTINNLAAIADALGVEIRIGTTIDIVERCIATAFLEQAARSKAERIAKLVQGTSALEAQAVDTQFYEELIQQSVHDLMAGPRGRLWAA